MTKISQAAGFSRPDDFYAELLAAHEGLSKAQSDALNARLILLMAAQIGDFEALKGCLERAKAAG